MPPHIPAADAPTPTTPGFAIMRRFLPYLWPKDQPGLRVRIIFALLLVVVSKLIQFSMGWLYGQAIDRMVPSNQFGGMERGVTIAIALVAAYAGARFGGVLFDNLRNVVFEKVGQDATRRQRKMFLPISITSPCGFI